MRVRIIVLIVCLFGMGAARAQDAAAPTSRPAVTEKLPHLQVDVGRKQVRVECEAVAAQYPLEFFCVVSGGNEYESVLRSPVKPSHLHLALLMLGLEPGRAAHYSEQEQRWFPPRGPALDVRVQFEKDGQTVSVPASRLMRSLHTQKQMPEHTWIFSGSMLLEDGRYLADVTGTIISVVNVDAAVIDVPDVASKAMESREWEPNPDLLPPPGTKMWMILEPAKEPASTTPTTAPAKADADGGTSDSR